MDRRNMLKTMLGAVAVPVLPAAAAKLTASKRKPRPELSNQMLKVLVSLRDAAPAEFSAALAALKAGDKDCSRFL